jgi:hypothetical protein
MDEVGRYRNYKPWWTELEAYYLDKDGHPKQVKDSERSLGRPTVRIEIEF